MEQADKYFLVSAQKYQDMKRLIEMNAEKSKTIESSPKDLQVEDKTDCKQPEEAVTSPDIQEAEPQAEPRNALPSERI